MKALIRLCLALTASCLSLNAYAFCGFFVAKADTSLFNQASQVVLVRDDDRTVLTMASDYQGEAKDFAMVIPVPTFITREQIHVADPAVIAHLDAYTSPRLAEYFDADPCRPRIEEIMMSANGAASPRVRRESSGVTIEAEYTVGEYDILILSATESSGLIDWLKANDYRIPDGAEPVVNSYLKQGMRFFVAKVNLDEHDKLGFAKLRPLQVAYEHDRFMLPIRLGTVNANGTQELFVYALTRTGRVETTNYRTVRLPSNMEVPVYVKEEFPDFYRDLFKVQVTREDMQAVFLEYAWDMGWCDPCAADPLNAKQLRELGVFWLDGGDAALRRQPAQNVFVTRLHVRYDAETFPEDLMFHETGDRTNFQGRYVIRHAWNGQPSCEAAERYLESLNERRHKEAETLASLTGWDIDEIRRRMTLNDSETEPEKNWWQRLWND